MTIMSDKKKTYDCKNCSYARYNDGHTIFCDVCMRKIMNEQREKKQRKDNADGR